MKEEKPTLAPGSEDALAKGASEEQIRKGNFTKVTRLSFDEVDNG